MRGTNGVAKLGAELLNDEGETSRNLVEHCVAERPVRLRRDLLLGVPRRHFQLQQRVKVIWILQNRSQTSHSSGYDRTRSVLLQFVTVLLWIFAHDDDYGGFFRSSPMVGSWLSVVSLETQRYLFEVENISHRVFNGLRLIDSALTVWVGVALLFVF